MDMVMTDARRRLQHLGHNMRQWVWQTRTRLGRAKRRWRRMPPPSDA
jgi:hypothetical protein